MTWKLYFSFALLFFCDGTPTILGNPGAGDFMDVESLGRPAVLGELYNAVTRKFLAVTIFLKEPTIRVPEPGKNCSYKYLPLAQTTDINYHEVNMGVVTSLQEKVRLLDADPEKVCMAVDIKSGIVKVKPFGNAGYINDEKRNKSHVEGFYQVKERTVREQLPFFFEDLRPFLNLPMIKNQKIQATHVVIAVEYGGDLLVKFLNTNEKNEKVKRLTDDLQADFNKLKPKPIPAPTNTTTKPVVKPSFSTEYILKVFTDISLDGSFPPHNLDDVLELTTKFPQMVKKANGGKGKPMKYVLMPLELIHHFFYPDEPRYASDGNGSCIEKPSDRLVVHKIDEVLMTDVLASFSDYIEAQSIFNVAQDKLEKHQSERCVTAVLLDGIRDLNSNLRKTAFSFRRDVRKSILEIRSGKKDEKDLEHINKLQIEHQYTFMSRYAKEFSGVEALIDSKRCNIDPNASTTTIRSTSTSTMKTTSTSTMKPTTKSTTTSPRPSSSSRYFNSTTAKYRKARK